jgi:hypothetical protein
MNLYMEKPQTYCYSFYEPIYCMDSSVKFPQHNMLPGYFLSIARTTGDSFTLLVTQGGHITGRVLHYSVIRKRCSNEHSPHAGYQLPALPSYIAHDPMSDIDDTL